MELPKKTVHRIPIGDVENLVVNYWKGVIAFRHTAVENKHDCTSLLEWEIVEYDGKSWVRASAAAREKVRELIRYRFERDATRIDGLVTTLIHTLVKLQEHEDGPHTVFVE